MTKDDELFLYYLGLREDIKHKVTEMKKIEFDRGWLLSKIECGKRFVEYGIDKSKVCDILNIPIEKIYWLDLDSFMIPEEDNRKIRHSILENAYEEGLNLGKENN